MKDNRPPRPAAELFPEALQLSTKQREVLDQLQTYPQGARSVDLAADLGMHVNTVRGHLDELIARGAVHATTSPAQGRGRPSLIFQTTGPSPANTSPSSRSSPPWCLTPTNSPPLPWNRPATSAGAGPGT